MKSTRIFTRRIAGVSLAGYAAATVCAAVLTVAPASARQHEPAPAQHAAAPAGDVRHGASEPAAHDPQPALSDDAIWSGAMLIIVAGLFVAAAVVGPIIRSEMPEEPANAHGHDDHSHSAHGHADAHHTHGNAHGSSHGH